MNSLRKLKILLTLLIATSFDICKALPDDTTALPTSSSKPASSDDTTALPNNQESTPASSNVTLTKSMQYLRNLLTPNNKVAPAQEDALVSQSGNTPTPPAVNESASLTITDPSNPKQPTVQTAQNVTMSTDPNSTMTEGIELDTINLSDAPTTPDDASQDTESFITKIKNSLYENIPTRAQLLASVPNLITTIKTYLSISMTPQEESTVRSKLSKIIASLPELPTLLQVQQFVQQAINMVRNIKFPNLRKQTTSNSSSYGGPVSSAEQRSITRAMNSAPVEMVDGPTFNSGPSPVVKINPNATHNGDIQADDATPSKVTPQPEQPANKDVRSYLNIYNSMHSEASGNEAPGNVQNNNPAQTAVTGLKNLANTITGYDSSEIQPQITTHADGSRTQTITLANGTQLIRTVDKNGLLIPKSRAAKTTSIPSPQPDAEVIDLTSSTGDSNLEDESYNGNNINDLYEPYSPTKNSTPSSQTSQNNTDSSDALSAFLFPSH